MIQGSKVESSFKVLHYGMVGGGEGSMIGDVHRRAAVFDRKCELVAGCFSRNYENTVKTGSGLGIHPHRLYKNFEEMAQAEAKREEPIDFVTIVTPNYAHYAAAKAFLSSGINVICDKPLTLRAEEAEELVELAKQKDLLFCVTYTYSGYPILKQAREMIKNGKLGEIFMVMGEYAQDWLITKVEEEGNIQAAWRTNPALAGASTTIGDVGTHIENTAAYITGLKIKSLSAKLDVIGEGRTLDTNGSVMLRYSNGASGLYWASQVAVGNDNGLRIRVFGTLGSIEWFQEEPDLLKVSYIGQPTQIFKRGHSYLYPSVEARIPSGHPEGYYEAFANIYSKFASALMKKKAGEALNPEDLDFPDGTAGLEGMKFIEACVKSSSSGSQWVDL